MELHGGKIKGMLKTENGVVCSGRFFWDLELEIPMC